VAAPSRVLTADHFCARSSRRRFDGVDKAAMFDHRHGLACYPVGNNVFPSDDGSIWYYDVPRPQRRPQPEDPTMAADLVFHASRARVGLAWRSVATGLFALGVMAVAGQVSRAAEPAGAIPPPAADEPASAGSLQTVVLAGGCFWGIQAVYQHVEGVHQAVSGYAGGASPNPAYEQVSTGRTGYAESVQVTFDPRKVSLGKISRSSSPSLTTRPSSTGRDRTSGRNTARPSFILTNR
jgi:hypothetical protein